MEVYVDDMLAKSIKVDQHVGYLKDMFDILRRSQMKLNPLKYAFGVALEKFLCFMVNQRGMKANPEKNRVIQETQSPKKPKDVQKLTGCVAALNRFISKATDKCIPFFNVLRGNKRFEWNTKCEEAFQQLKSHLEISPILSKPVPREKLSIYLAVSKHAVSSVLIRV